MNCFAFSEVEVVLNKEKAYIFALSQEFPNCHSTLDFQVVQDSIVS